MNNTLVLITLLGILTALPTIAGDERSTVRIDQSAGDKIPATAGQDKAEYISGPVECTVIEVSIQYESSNHNAEFHCVEEPANPDSMDGMVFELKNLPVAFEQTYRGRLTSGSTKLRASKIYRSGHQLIFTEDTVWSISGESN